MVLDQSMSKSKTHLSLKHLICCLGILDTNRWPFLSDRQLLKVHPLLLDVWPGLSIRNLRLGQNHWSQDPPSSTPPYPRGLRPPCRIVPPWTTCFGPPDVSQALGRGPRRPLAGWLTVRRSCGAPGVRERFGTVQSGSWSSLCRWCHCYLGVWEQAEISTSYL